MSLPPSRPARARALGLALLSLPTLACGGADEPDPPSSTGPQLRIVSGAGTSDTIDAEPSAPLVVHVTDAGKPVRGAVVTFTGTRGANDYGTGVTIAAAPYGTRQYRLALNDTTGPDGVVRVQLGMGGIAGPAALAITVPVLGLVDTARFTVRPGAAVGVRVEPRDTAVYVGQSVVMRAATFDRGSNSRPDPIALVAGSPGRVTMSGVTVTGRAIGATMLRVSVGAWRDSATISVVPRATVVAYDAYAVPKGLFVFALDGSGYRRQLSQGAAPAWSPDGATLYYHDARADGSLALMALDVATGAIHRVAAVGNQLGNEAFPVASRDGAWVYYNGRASNGWSLYRIRPDGSGRELVSPDGGTQLWPSLSPDGTRVASLGADGALQVMDLATRRVVTIRDRSDPPAWSPSSDYIAYVANDHRLHVARADGSDDRVVGTTRVAGRPAWLPDGTHLLISSETRLLLTDVATGEEMLLGVVPTLSNLYDFAVKP